MSSNSSKPLTQILAKEETEYFEQILTALMTAKDLESKILTEEQIISISTKARSTLLQESTLLHLSKTPLVICGTTGGRLDVLQHIFNEFGLPNAKSTNYLFIGDIIREHNSINAMFLLMTLKVMFPDKIHILRGKQECEQMSRQYGLLAEFERDFNEELWKLVVDQVFNCMPLAAIVSNKYFCVSGGLSPYMTDVREIDDIERPTEVPIDGLMTDLLWSNPVDGDDIGWGIEPKGSGFYFGHTVVDNFLKENQLELVIRSTQIVYEGHSWMNPGAKLLNLFSTPNFMGRVGNAASVMTVDEQDKIKLTEIKLPPRAGTQNNQE